MSRNDDALISVVAYDTDTAIKAAEVAVDYAKRGEDAAQRVADAPRAAAEQAAATRDARARLEVASEETTWLRRLMPRRNLWPELQELDDRIAALDLRRAEAAADAEQLEHELRRAEEHDRVALAAWHGAGASGSRPAPTATAVRDRIEQRRADEEAIGIAAGDAAAEKARFVEKHRDRLVRAVDEHVDRLHGRYLDLVDELERTRDELLDHRAASLWVRLYPRQEAANEPPRMLALGLAKPIKDALGISTQLDAARIWTLLRTDAELAATAISGQQKAAINPDVRDPTSAAWAGSELDEGAQLLQLRRERFHKATGRWPDG